MNHKWMFYDILFNFQWCLAAIIFIIYQKIKVYDFEKLIKSKPNSHLDFETFALLQKSFNNLVALLIFFSWIKLIEYVRYHLLKKNDKIKNQLKISSFNKSVKELRSTINRCLSDLIAFLLLFFIIFFAFAQLGTLLFGSRNKDYFTFTETS